jgi:zinc and cadmium transporter
VFGNLSVPFMYMQLILYCAIIAVASFSGGSIPSFVKLTHRRIQLTISLVSGVMLGVALLHLLPHAIYKLANVGLALQVCLGGLLFMFFMVRMFHFHQHDLAAETEHDRLHKDLCDHEEDNHVVHCDHHDGKFDLSWAGLCFGLAIHTLIDGIALAAAVQQGSRNDFSIASLGVFLAIVLHKPLDALSITSLMAARGWDISKQLTVNLVFSLMCPLGAILFAIGVDQFVDFRDTILGIALAFSAGIFLCISLGDLLPEVHFHSHDRLKLSAMLLLGVAIAWAIEFLPGHNHGEKNSAVFASSGQQIISVESESEKRSESREGSGSSSLK